MASERFHPLSTTPDELSALRQRLEQAETERAQALVEREQLRRLFEQAPAYICSLAGPTHVFEYVNDRYYELLGRRDLIGKPAREAVPELEAQGYFELLDGVYATGEPVVAAESRVELKNPRDGTFEIRYLDFVYQPNRAADGQVVGILAHAVDVTEKVLVKQRIEQEVVRRTEELQTQKQLTERIIDSAPLGISYMNRELIYEWVNPTQARLWGLPADQVIGRSVHAVFGLAPDAEIGKLLRAVIETGEPVSGSDYPITYLVDGQPRSTVWDFSYQPVRGHDGAVIGVLVTADEVTERQQAEARTAAYHRELAAQKVFAESLIQNVPAGIAYLDRELVFRVVNPVYAAFLGLRAAEMVDRHLFDVLPSDRSQIEPLLLRVLETGQPYNASDFPFTYRTPEGVERTTYWDFVYYPVRPSEHEPVQGIFVLANEISARMVQQREQRQLREEQERLNRERIEALEQSDRLKEQFLGILSHELRTPINAIMGFGSVLDDEVAGPLNDTQHGYTAKILSSADALLALIEDLLIVSRVHAGKFSVRPQPTRFPELVRDALETQAPAAERKRLRLVNQVPDDLPELSADPLRLVQVLNNLVGNAIKFTPPEGQVTVRARLEGEALRCEVTDTGIGIAAADQAKLFQRFTQLDMSSTRSASGVGLGLSIVKAIVAAHGGEVGIESEPGRGATFWFTLPLTASPEPSSAQPA